MSDVGTDKPRGRPRLFDEVVVLDRAIDLFSSSGFSAVGINELTRATRVKVGSLYKAYQDKEGLFSKALERYIALREGEIAAILAQAENGRARIAGLLRLYVRLSSGKEGRLGCLMVAGIGEISKFSFAGNILHGQLSRRQMLLADVVSQGKADGSITTVAEPNVVANLLLTLLYGMRVVGKAEALIGDTDAFVDLALKVLD
ncbi:TetR/AcrR family transcriptional regulator [Oryzifoliimicrobium ureilyticus]|uniref:TetR/AcrR family transcriptional regulator n=1 Tax=Oryzifoliimicrobium ureilyticus TaxID=3113724 RepID=UPI00307618C3